MNDQQRAAMQMALEALKLDEWGFVSKGNKEAREKAITALREALVQHPMDYDQGFVDGVEEGLTMAQPQENGCNQHPDAPHGFCRNESHNQGRYVCECEFWEPPASIMEQYPENFKQCFDFSPPDGWKDIVKQLVHDVIKAQPDIQIEQVKEKFGSMRFYVDSATEEVYDLIERAEALTEKTCQVCGRLGEIRRVGGWYACVCPEHGGD